MAAAAALLLTNPSRSFACVGAACLQIWSTADGGGALTIQWHFDDPTVHATAGFCAGGQCSYSTIDPGFITSTDAPSAGYFALVDGTDVSVEIVANDAPTKLKIESTVLDAPGESFLLGSAPTLHQHPSWQLKLADGEIGDYALSLKLTTTSALYDDSATYVLTLSNRPTPTPDGPTGTATPTATPTAVAPRCAGDCNGDGRVSIDELLRAVNMTLVIVDPPDACLATFDIDGDGHVAINELVAAVNNALSGCPIAPTPTATRPASFSEIQTTIFAPRCAIAPCHDTTFHTGNLVLDADHAYLHLIGVPPSVDSAAQAGVLRVDPGHPDNSFLLTKLEGPPDGQGSRMPLDADPLSADEIQLIRDWIAQGAKRN